MQSCYLLIDIGNSFSKLALYFSLSHQLQHSHRVHFTEIIKQIKVMANEFSINFVFICSVKKKQQTTVLIEQMKLVLACDIELFSPLKYQLLSSQYDDFTTLGADRWAAILAIYLQGEQNFCIIDCGTAITIDYVINNSHQGGLISPGITTYSNCLIQSADYIKTVDQISSVENILFAATSTSEALINASKLYFISFIDSILQHNRDIYKQGLVTYITGGEALLYQQHKTKHINYIDNLVLDGLQQIIIQIKAYNH